MRKQLQAQQKKDEAILAEIRKAELKAEAQTKVKYTGWQPRLWSGNGIAFETIKFQQQLLDYKVNEIPIYVDENNFFLAKLPALKITWANRRHLKFVHKSKMDLTDPYFVSLVAAFTQSYRCGLTKEHLEFSKSTPKIITSLMRYFLYFRMQQFLQKPQFSTSLKDEILEVIIRKSLWLKNTNENL